VGQNLCHASPSQLQVAKWTGPNGPTYQPVLKGTSWVEDFNLLACSNPFRPACQLDGPRYEPARLDPLVHFKKEKVIKKIKFLYYIF